MNNNSFFDFFGIKSDETNDSTNINFSNNQNTNKKIKLIEPPILRKTIPTQKYLIISDMHLNHKNIYDRRKFNSPKEMTEWFIDYWNSIITDEEIKSGTKILNLGDFILDTNYEDIEPLIKKFNHIDKMMLIIGNHETHNRMKIYTKYFNCVSWLVEKSFLFTHVPVHPSILTNNYINCHGHLHDYSIEDTTKYINFTWDMNNCFLELWI